MRVELPKLLSVVAHEVRGPLSVIQGYLRLMLTQRDAAHTETPMIRAMLDATGRLARLGRQASDLAVWAGAAAASNGHQVTLAALADKAAALVVSGSATVKVDDRDGHQPVGTSDPDALAAALAALAESTARETGGPVELGSCAASDSDMVTLTVQPTLEARADRGERPAAGPASGPVAFDRGGFGLSLVLASYVLDAHGAEVRTAGRPGGVEVRLHKAGGSK